MLNGSVQDHVCFFDKAMCEKGGAELWKYRWGNAHLWCVGLKEGMCNDDFFRRRRQGVVPEGGAKIPKYKEIAEMIYFGG